MTVGYPTTNLENGITNVGVNAAMGSLIAPDPSRWHLWFNDFDLYTATDWTVTETQAGATQAILANTDGGILALVNSAANDDINAVKWANNTFVLPTTKSWWVKGRMKVSSALVSDVIFGLVDVMTGFNPAYGVYLTKVNGAATFGLAVENNSAVTAGATASQAIVNDTYFDVAITFDATAGQVTGWLNDSPFASVTTLTNMPTAALAIAAGVQNGDGNARTLSIDYLMAAIERG